MIEASLRLRLVVLHSCGHEEEHRLVVEDEKIPNGWRLPNETEAVLIEDDLRQRSCNACLAKVPPGTHGIAVSLLDCPRVERRH